MAKDIQTIKSQFQVIQNETIESANTASRVGGAGYDLAEYVGDNRTGIIPYFNTEAELNASRPNTSNGEQSWVGTPYPGTVWNVVDGVWIDTTVVPDVNTVNLNSYLLNGGTTKTGAQLDAEKSSKTETRLTILGGDYVHISGDIKSGSRSDRGYSVMLAINQGITLEHMAVIESNRISSSTLAAIILYDDKFVSIGYITHNVSGDDITMILDATAILSNFPSAKYFRVNVTADKGFNVKTTTNNTLLVADEKIIDKYKLSNHSDLLLAGTIDYPELYINIDTDRCKITVPETSRIVTKYGVIKNLVPGIYDIPYASAFIFANIYTGDIIILQYGDMVQADNLRYLNTTKYLCLGNVSAHLRDASLIGNHWMLNGKIKGIVSDNIPKINNNTIRRKDISEPLKILFFGSSWFMNTWWYLNKIIKSAGINAELTGFYVGSASFSTWNGFWDNDTVSDCWTSTNGSDWVQSTAPFKTTLLNKWDIIGFQQGAWQSRTWDAYSNLWSSLVSHVKESCGIDTVIAFNSTWTPAINGELSPYPNTIDGQKQWQQDSYNMTKRFMSLSGIYNVSPCGAAMWAMRRNPELNLGNDLATDHLHPDAGLPMYALSGVFFETYISPMYGVSFNAVNWLPDVDTQQSPAAAYAYQPIDTTQRDIIRKIIKLAISDRFGFSSAPSNNIATESSDIPVPSIKNVAISQADYNSLSVKDPNTIYYVY